MTHDRSRLPLQRVAPENYELGREIARGGMGRIIAATDLRLGRAIAVKELLSSSAIAKARFEREATITARLQHPSIVPIHEVGVWPNGESFYTMKHVEGESFDAVIARSPALAQRLALLPHLIDVADALAYAHSRQIIHRDLKPSNILIGSYGETVVIDWGLAKDLTESRDQTSAAVFPRGVATPEDSAAGPEAWQTTLEVTPEEVPAPDAATPAGALTIDGSAMGTPAYMPPEQARGQAADARADVYSFGAMLYHLLAGKPPYADAPDVRAAISAVLTGAALPLKIAAPDAPNDLVAITEKAMSRDPADRYSDCGQLSAELRRFTTGQLVTAHRYSSMALLRRWVSRRRTFAIFAAALIIIVTSGSTWFLIREQRLRRGAEDARALAEEGLARADSSLVGLLREQGRMEFVAGHPLRALPYLLEAYSRGDDSPVLRTLLADAMRPLDSKIAEFGDGTIVSVQFDASGKRLLTFAGDTLTVWALDRQTSIVEVDAEEIDAAAFHPNGDRIATASLVSGLQIWDANTGLPIATSFPSIPTAVAQDVATDPRGRQVNLELPQVVAYDRTGALLGVASASALWILDESSGDEVAHFALDYYAARSLAFSPDGKRIAASSYGADVTFWDLSTRTVADTIAGIRGEGIAYSPDGTRLLVGQENRKTLVVDLSARRVLATLDGDHATYDAEGRTIATTTDEDVAKLWDAETFQTNGTLLGDNIEFAPNGASMASVVDGRAAIWKSTSKRLLWSAEEHSPVFSPDGTRMMTVGADSAIVRKTGSNEIQLTIPHPGVEEVGFSADGARFYTRDSHRIRIWNVADASSATTLTVGDRIHSVAFSPDGGRLLVGTGRRAEIWDIPVSRLRFALGEPVRVDPGTGSYRSPGDVVCARFSRSGRQVVIMSEEGGASVFVAETGERLFGAPAPMSHRDLAEIQFSANGDRVLATSNAGTAIWDSMTGELVTRTGGRASYSRDGKQILTINHSRVELLDATTGEVFAQSGEGSERVVAGAFDPTGKRIATATEDGTIRLYDAGTGSLIARFSGAAKPVRIAFTPDGQQLVVASEDMIWLWDTHEETRSARELAATIGKDVPWSYRDGRLLHRTAD